MKNNETFDLVTSDGKKYIMEWRKQEGSVAITQAIPEPSAEDIWDVLQLLDEDDVKKMSASDLIQEAVDLYDGHLETYDYGQRTV